MPLLVTNPRPQVGQMQPPELRMPPMAPTEPEPVEPAVAPFRTNLQLAPDRLRWLVDRAVTRIEEVSREMGLGPNGQVRGGSWMAVRERNQDTYDKDLEWRRALGGIFATSNFTLGDNNRYARLIAARVRDDLLGTRPFFGAISQKDGDARLVNDVEQYVQERIDQSNVPETLREALRTAVVRNEAVVKTTYVVDQTRYIGPATVLVDDVTGMPVLTPDRGEFVYERDDMVPDPTTEGLFRLKKDPSFSIAAGQGTYQKFDALPQKLTHYDNVQAEVLEYRDFLCPLKFRATWMADINVHLYERSAEQLRAAYAGIDTAAVYFGGRGGRTGAKQAHRKQGEGEEEQSQVLENILVAEVYIRCDADGDGIEEEIMLVLDLENEEAIFYDYLGNHMSHRPFAVIPGVERELGRWYAIGVFSKMEHNQLYVDSQFNRINEKDSQESSATFRIPQAVKQWKNGAPTKLGTRQILDLEAGYDLRNNPPIGRINLQSDAQLGTELMGVMRQAGDLEFAVISARDASASNLNQSKTATGVMSVERDANVVSKDMEIDIAGGLEKVLEQAVELLLENMNESELMFSKDGAELITLNRDEIRSLERRVRLLLTRTRSAELLVTNEKAEAIWIRYMQLDPRMQHIGRPLYVRQLKGLEIDDADELLPEVTKEQVVEWEEAQRNAQPPKEDKQPSVAISYADAPPSVQRQMEADAGYQPATPEEVAEIQAREDAEKAAKNANGSRASAADSPAGRQPESRGG